MRDTTDRSEYLLGTSETELERLGFQHQVWQRETAELIRRAGFGFGQRLLDVGCGPGLVSVELARLAGSTGAVHGVDASKSYLNACRDRAAAESLRNLTLEEADLDEWQAPGAGFDGAFARWLLCFVERPEALLATLFEALRPGGRLVVIDYFNYLSVAVEPRDPAIQRIFEAYSQSAAANGYGFDIGGQLPGLLTGAGFELLDVDAWVRVARPGDVLWRWVSLFHQSYGPQMESKGLMSASEMRLFRRAWARAEADPDSLFSSPPMLALVARKPTSR